jgi:hypothetical protein
VFAPFVPIFVKPVPMNVPNLIAKYANNVQRSADNVRKAAKKWQLKILSKLKTFFGIGVASFMVLPLFLFYLSFTYI